MRGRVLACAKHPQKGTGAGSFCRKPRSASCRWASTRAAVGRANVPYTGVALCAKASKMRRSVFSLACRGAESDCWVQLLARSSPSVGCQPGCGATGLVDLASPAASSTAEAGRAGKLGRVQGMRTRRIFACSGIGGVDLPRVVHVCCPSPTYSTMSSRHCVSLPS